MATTDSGDGGGGPVTARSFVEERLRDADSPMSPSELAGEYGCTNGHVRNLLMDMVDQGVVERVRHGKYIASASDEDGVDADLQDDVSGSSEGNVTAETNDEDNVPPTAETQETGEPVDGEAPSEDPDTAVEDGPESGEGGRPELDDDDYADIPTEAVGAAGAAGGTMLLSGISDGGLKTWHVVALLVVAGVGWYLLQSSSSGDGDDADDGAVEDDQEASGGGLANFDATELENL